MRAIKKGWIEILPCLIQYPMKNQDKCNTSFGIPIHNFKINIRQPVMKVFPGLAFRMASTCHPAKE